MGKRSATATFHMAKCTPHPPRKDIVKKNEKIDVEYTVVVVVVGRVLENPTHEQTVATISIR